MEGTDLKGALQRGWRLLLLVALFGGVIGIVLPGKSAPQTPPVYVASSIVTISGKGTGGVTELATVASNRQVQGAAASKAGLNVPPSFYGLLFSFANAKGYLGKHIPVVALSLTSSASTAAQAARIDDSYVSAVQSYLTQQLDSGYALNLCKSQQEVTNLSDELNTIDGDITTEEAGGSVDPSTIPPPAAFDPSQCSSSSGNSKTAAFVGGAGSDSGAVLDATTPTTAPAVSTPSTTTPTTAPATGSTSDPASGSQSTSSQAKSDPILEVLLSDQKSVTAELNSFADQLTQLTLDGPPGSGFTVLSEATKDTAVLFTAKHSIVSSSLLAHPYTKALIGLLGGGVLAALIVLLVELADKSVRTVAGTEDAYGYPVVAEIPMWPPDAARKNRGTPPPPRLDVVMSPTSPSAEAYRRLRTALLLEPLAAEVAARMGANASLNGFGMLMNGYMGAHSNGYVNGNGNGNGNGHNGHSAHSNGHNGYLGAQSGSGAEDADVPPASNGHRVDKRQVFLVVSAGREPSRPAVTANVAAAFGEAGARVLVLTRGDFTVQRPQSDLPFFSESGDEVSAEDIAPRTTHSAVAGVYGLAFDQVLARQTQVVTHGPAVIDAARELADFVIVEGPPLLRSHDALALLPAVDVVLVVAEFSTTAATSAKQAGAALRRFDAPVLGVVLTNVRTKEKSLEPASATPMASVVLRSDPRTAQIRR